MSSAAYTAAILCKVTCFHFLEIHSTVRMKTVMAALLLALAVGQAAGVLNSTILQQQRGAMVFAAAWPTHAIATIRRSQQLHLADCTQCRSVADVKRIHQPTCIYGRRVP
jgi:hypothetical protein